MKWTLLVDFSSFWSDLASACSITTWGCLDGLNGSTRLAVLGNTLSKFAPKCHGSHSLFASALVENLKKRSMSIVNEIQIQKWPALESSLVPDNSGKVGYKDEGTRHNCCDFDFPLDAVQARHSCKKLRLSWHHPFLFLPSAHQVLLVHVAKKSGPKSKFKIISATLSNFPLLSSLNAHCIDLRHTGQKSTKNAN